MDTEQQHFAALAKVATQPARGQRANPARFPAWNRPEAVHRGLADPTIPTLQAKEIPSRDTSRSSTRSRTGG
jgi:hypothetical protein